MREEWRPVVGYEGFYEVSNLGRVRGVDRKDARGVFRPGILRKTRIDKKTGYEYVYLRKDGMEKNCTVHRLVAQAFLPAPDGDVEVNHINENRTDNRAENLEWVTRKQNSNHGHHNERLKRSTKNSHGKPVLMLDLETGEAIREFVTCSEAARSVGVSKTCISKCCLGKSRTASGYCWKYKE